MRYFPLIIILLFAAILFLDGTAERALWTDEGYSILVSQQPSIPAILEYTVLEDHPPLFPIVLHLWGKGVGGQPVALRYSGVLIGLLSIAVLYRLSLDIFDQWAAAAAGLMLASSDLVIGLTSMTRQYHLYMLLAILSTWLYWRYQKRWHRGYGLAYTMTGIALLYSLYWGAFILMVHGVHAMITQPRRLHYMIVPALVIGLCFVPQLPRFMNSATGEGYSQFGGSLATTLNLTKTDLQILFFQLAGIPEALYIGLALAGLMVWNRINNRKNDPRLDPPPPAGEGRWGLLLIGLWFLFPLIFSLGLTAVGIKMLTHRPMIALIPGMAVLIGHTLAQMPRWSYSVLLAILLVNNLTTIGADYRARPPWWEVSDQVAAYSSPQDAILIEAGFDAYSMEVHLRLADLPTDNLYRIQQMREGWDGGKSYDVLALMDQHESVWLLEFVGEDLRGDLAALGFVQTTPQILQQVELPLIHAPTTLTRFARPPQGEPLAAFSEALILAEAHTFQHNGRLGVDLTWQVQAPTATDYSISVFLLNSAGQVVMGHDGYPFDNLSPTSGWQTGAAYFDRHNLDIASLPPGTYTLAVKVYTWWDQAVQPAAPCDMPDCQYFVVGHIDL